jgi:hypothetical protein
VKTLTGRERKVKQLTTQSVYETVRETFSAPDAMYGYDLKRFQCVYRGGGDPESPLRCSVGVLIPDSEYNPGWDYENGTTVAALLEFGSEELIRHFENVDKKFLSHMQGTHDDCARSGRSTSRFIELLDRAAQIHGLQVVTV